MGKNAIDPFDKSYFLKLDEYYGSNVIVGKKTTEELIKFCDKKYGLTKVCFDDLDDIGKSHLKCFIENLSVYGVCKENTNLYLLSKNKLTQPSYDYYYRHYESYYKMTDNECKVFVFADPRAGHFHSNSAMFDSLLQVLSGIDKSDIDEKNLEYFHYLVCLEMYDNML